MAYKVFTNGSVLQASEINENLMRQAVATFTNAAARTAAIASPVEGQFTYLADTDRLQFWNGSAWVSPFGSTLLASATITSTASFSVNDVFTSEFDNYQIVFNGNSGSGVGIHCRVRSAGTDVSTGYSSVEGLLVGSFAPQDRTVNTATTMPLVTKNAFGDKFCNATIYSPFLSQPTRLSSYGGNDAACVSFCAGDLQNSNSYTGITILSSNGTNFTGRLQIYGLRK